MFCGDRGSKKREKVVLVEKGATKRSGAAGTGFDHWESACTNPCSQVTPEEIANAYVDEQDHYSNGIAHYIECREGYDRMLDLEVSVARSVIRKMSLRVRNSGMMRRS